MPGERRAGGEGGKEVSEAHTFLRRIRDTSCPFQRTYIDPIEVQKGLLTCSSSWSEGDGRASSESQVKASSCSRSLLSTSVRETRMGDPGEPAREACTCDSKRVIRKNGRGKRKRREERRRGRKAPRRRIAEQPRGREIEGVRFLVGKKVAREDE